ncbi:MAG: sulfite exporter TauE/SafE family protein [Anaerolineae bacterium]
MYTLPLMALGGALAGMLGSMLGIGGGFIVVPMLTILFRIPMHLAVSAGQAAVMATSSMSAAYYVRERLSHIRLGILLETTSTIGAVGGAMLGTRLDERWLAAIFGLAMMYMAWQMNRKKEGAGSAQVTAENCRIVNLPAGMSSSLLAGVLSGLLGIGGGIVKVPVMCLVMGIPMKVATATSVYTLGITAVAGATVYYSHGMTDLLVAGAIAAGVFCGALVGPRLARRVRSQALRTGFAIVAVYTGYNMIVKALPLPKVTQVLLSLALAAGTVAVAAWRQRVTAAPQMGA